MKVRVLPPLPNKKDSYHDCVGKLTLRAGNPEDEELLAAIANTLINNRILKVSFKETGKWKMVLTRGKK